MKETHFHRTKERIRVLPKFRDNYANTGDKRNIAKQATGMERVEVAATGFRAGCNREVHTSVC